MSIHGLNHSEFEALKPTVKERTEYMNGGFFNELDEVLHQENIRNIGQTADEQRYLDRYNEMPWRRVDKKEPAWKQRPIPTGKGIWEQIKNTSTPVYKLTVEKLREIMRKLREE